MKQSALFRLILLMPVLLALPALLLPGTLNIFVFQLATLALLSATFPYAIFTITALIWSRNRSHKEIKKAIWLTPPVFALVYFVYSLVSPYPSLGSADSGILHTLALSFFALVYGYCCVTICLTVSVAIRIPALTKKWLTQRS